jgi:hypothetical protein
MKTLRTIHVAVLAVAASLSLAAYRASLAALLRAGATLLLATTTLPSLAASVLPVELDHIIDRSTIAFEGRCLENRSERDGATGFVVTFTTFAVVDALKGQLGSTHTIKQIGGSLPDESLQYKVEGVPSFTVGEEYVVFLAGVSHLGFSSPIALGQGRFGIRAGESGREVGNGRDFRELAANIPHSQLPSRALARMQGVGPVRQISLDDFKQIVRTRIGGGQ